MWTQKDGLRGADEAGAVDLTPRAEPREAAFRPRTETVVCALGETEQQVSATSKGSLGFQAEATGIKVPLIWG